MQIPFLTWTSPNDTSANKNETFETRSKHYIENCKTFMHNGMQIFPNLETLEMIFTCYDKFKFDSQLPTILCVEGYEYNPPSDKDIEEHQPEFYLNALNV